MIASLNGQIQDVFSDSLVVEVGGVGLQVYVPNPLKDEVRSGQHIHLHTYLVVRQDALILYGFATRDERELFTLLLGVNGVVVIGHGRSNAKAIKNAVRVAVRCVEEEVLDSIKQGIADMQKGEENT